MDIYDTGLMGTTARSGTQTPDGTNTSKSELDQNVEKMVGNISTWWSGIAKKSQDSINQARQQVESQGGIVNYAKSNYAKIESSIADAQKRAREQSSGEAAAASSEDQKPSIISVDKGKQRVLDEQPQEVTPTGPSLGASVSSLFTKITADPRLQQLQNSLTTTLQSVSNSQQPQLNQDGTPRSPIVGGPTKLQDSLAKLSLTFQSHLPHLDFKESQQLATKYLHATENFAKEIQTDMTDLVNELVRIVPPEGEAIEKTAPTTDTSDAPHATIAASDPVTAPQVDEEDFVWDEEDEETANDAKPVSAAADATPMSPESKLGSEAANAEDDEDSDWE